MTADKYPHTPRNLTKAVHSLLGICSGITADNQLHDAEIHFLATWIKDNLEATECWPGNVIRQRVEHVMADGVITEEEREQLLATLKDLSGMEFMETGSSEAAPVTFPADDVPISFEGNAFCLTGKFIFGPRSNVERIIENLGGTLHGNVTKKTNYLIVGTLSSPDWLHSSHGLKIKKAVEYKQTGCPISVITEKSWLEAVS